MSAKGSKKLRKEFNRRSGRILRQMIDDVRNQSFWFRMKFAWLIIKPAKKKGAAHE